VENSVSSSIFYDDIRLAMQGFMDHAPEGNWYALATFSKDLKVQVDFTKQEGRIMDAYSGLGEPAWDETDVYDATYQMLDKMAEMKGRRILIVIASGFDTFSRHSLTDVQKKVESSNVVIYGIGLGSMLRGVDEPYLSTGAQMDLTVARNFLTMLSRESGGEAWFPMEEGAYPSIMDGVMRDIATQYRMVYTPEVADDGKLHDIKVEAYQSEDQQGEEYKVIVRKGWRW
jgi:VWFA-related protein